MSAKNYANSIPQGDEILVHNDAVSLCFLVNRRARTLRVVDFRAGPSPAKRVVVNAVAQREGVDKVYTLVERDEVATWTKLGFAREGNIPAFYKRSDAFFLGAMTAPATRSEPRSGVFRTAPALKESADRDVETGIAEATAVEGKRIAKELGAKPSGAAKLAEIGAVDAKKYVAAAQKSGRAWSAFEPFGRDVQRRYFVLSGRSGWEIVASTETQTCFGNAFIELLTRPSSGAEIGAFSSAVRVLTEQLLKDGIVSSFALAGSHDVELAAVFAMNGFRKTGLLVKQLMVRRERVDAIVWSRKLAIPGED